MIAIVDYGMGNLRSVEKALQKLGHAAVITADSGEIARAERVILPGVGAFGSAMEHLTERRSGSTLAAAVAEAALSGRPFLGICLGMQLLLPESEEAPGVAGLGLVPGQALRFNADAAGDVKIPHMGWNTLRFPRRTALFEGLEDGAQVYFVHSYYCRLDEPAAAAAVCTHGIEFCAALARGRVFAAQFHPEKSGAAGLRMLDNFARLPSNSGPDETPCSK